MFLGGLNQLNLTRKLLFQFIVLFYVTRYSYLTYDHGSVVYPGWAHGLGLLLMLLPIVCVPIGAVHALVTASGSSLNTVSYTYGSLF